MSSLQLSDDERQRRREQALRLHEEWVIGEDGEKRRKFGGPQPNSGRPRNKRASEVIAEEAQKDAQDILGAIKAGLAEGQPAHIRLQAARDYLAVEEKERVVQEEERRALERMQRDELLDSVVERLTMLARSKQIDLGEILEHRKQLPAGEAT